VAHEAGPTYHFAARAAITYTDNDGADIPLTVAVFKNGRYITKLSGSAVDVMPGATTTVQLTSTDQFVSGAGTYSFHIGR
jgi:hypothetical protein